MSEPRAGWLTRVAVVVTSHDDGSVLGEALNSVLDQGCGAELIVVDGGSSDPATQKVLADYERSGVRVIRQEDHGQSAATMTGVSATDATYVMRFDGDDVLLPGTLEALAEALDANPQAAAAWGDVETFGLTSFRIPSVPELDPWLVTFTNCIPGSGTLYRRSSILEVGGWQLSSGYPDWDVWMGLAKTGHTGVYVPRPIFRYRRSHGSQMLAAAPRTARHYEALRARHPDLFAQRRATFRHSAAPLSLRVAVLLVERTPRLSRLLRIQLCEMLTHLLWNGGVRATLPMLWGAIRIRLLRHNLLHLMPYPTAENATE